MTWYRLASSQLEEESQDKWESHKKQLTHGLLVCKPTNPHVQVPSRMAYAMHTQTQGRDFVGLKSSVLGLSKAQTACLTQEEAHKGPMEWPKWPTTQIQNPTGHTLINWPKGGLEGPNHEKRKALSLRSTLEGPRVATSSLRRANINLLNPVSLPND